MIVLTPPNPHDPDTVEEVIDIVHKDLLGKKISLLNHCDGNVLERGVKDAAARRLRESFHHCTRRCLHSNYELGDRS